MVLMHWSYSDLCECPEDLLEEVVYTLKDRHDGS